MIAANELWQWVNRAEEDYLLCNSSLRRKHPLTYGAAFHAQQCVEKYLKALLLQQGIEFPKTHDLAALNYLCVKAGIILPVNEDDIEILTAYLVEARYPGPLPLLEEARKALEIAKMMRKSIRKLLGLKR